MRKRALEFDDVLNNQRSVIYGERRKILAKGDVRETVLDYLHDAAADLVDGIAPSSDPDDWDLAALVAALGPLLGRSDDITAQTFAGIETRDDLATKVGELVDETYEARETELGEETARAVERWLLLRTIDTHWVEHLTAMEELREGIYLRGYGQQDPLIAYKNEARTYFDEMTAKIANDVAQTILRISVRTAEQAEQEEKAPPPAQPNTTRTTASGPSTSAGPDRPSASNTGPAHKPGRNEPCWCGSGKKYKKCHGR
jgi:preprotein translocase subunit SecA